MHAFSFDAMTRSGSSLPFISTQGLNSLVEISLRPHRQFHVCGFLCRQSPRSLPITLLPIRSVSSSSPPSLTVMRSSPFAANRSNVTMTQSKTPAARIHSTTRNLPKLPRSLSPPLLLRSLLDFSGHVLVLTGQKKLAMTRDQRLPHYSPSAVPKSLFSLLNLSRQSQLPLFSSRPRFVTVFPPRPVSVSLGHLPLIF